MFKKWAKRIFLIVGVGFLLILVTLISLAFIYQERVKEYIHNEINKNYADIVHVEKINDVSILKTFPSLSVEVENIIVKELWENNPKDTLASIAFAYLKINLWDLFQNKITFDEIKLKQGEIYLKQDKFGKFNFIEEEKKDSNSTLFLDLTKVSLQNIKLSYEHVTTYPNINTYSIIFNKVAFSGNFSEKNYEMNINGFIKTHQIASAGYFTVNEKEVYIEGKCSVDQIKNIYNIQDLILEIEKKLSVKTNAHIVKNREGYLMNANFSLEEAEISDLSTVLSDSALKHIHNLNTSGIFDMQATYVGMLDAIHPPQISIKSHFKNTSFSIDSLNVQINNAKANLEFHNSSQNLQQFTLLLNGFEAEINKGTIHGNARIDDVTTAPFLKTDIQVERIPASLLNHYLKKNNITLTEPTSKINVHAEILFEQDFSVSKTQPVKYNGTLLFKDFDLHYTKNEPVDLEDINISAAFNNDFLDIQHFSAILGGEDEIKASGKISYTESNKAGFHIHCKTLHLEKALGLFSASGDPSDVQDTASLHIFLLGDINIDRFYYKKIELDHVVASLEYGNQVFQLKNFAFSGFDGEGVFNGTISNSKNRSVFEGAAHLKNINIQKLFSQFENFDQTFITQDNLKGIANLDVNYTIPFNSKGIELPKIMISSQIKIEKGELNNLQVFQDICDFVQQKKLYATFIDYKTMSSKFKNIKFSTLSNEIIIKDNKIFIPKMNIQTSAMGLEAKGIHSFNNEVNYSFSFYLSELMKKKEAKLEDGEWEIRQNNQKFLKIPCLMTGTVDNPIFSLDKQEAGVLIQKEIENEKKTARGILKGDTAITNALKKPKPMDIQFESSEFNRSAKPIEKEKPVEKTKKKPLFDLKKNEKEKEEVDFND